MSPESAAARPYRGIESYQAEDSDLFFGRDLETQRLVATILSVRTTILQAPSGAGKSSLLNARVIPDLESHGWTPVRARPENNPVVALRDATLRSVICDPGVEAAALERAVQLLTPDAEAPTLVDLVAAFDRLTPREPARRAAVAPVAVLSMESEPAQMPGQLRPHFLASVLRASLTLERYGAHLAMLAGCDAERSTFGICGSTTVRSLHEFLTAPRTLAAHANLMRALVLPVPGLAPFFLNLWEVHAASGLRLDFVLVIDQFEELFTRFVDSDHDLEPAVVRPDHRLRRLFFEDLRSLLRLRLPASASRVEADETSRGDFPLRLVLSLREEFVGRLGVLRQAVPELDERVVRLDYLNVAEARRAIAEPAQLFGYRYADDCYREILDSLVREKALGSDGEIVEGFVEPTALQIVCDKVWDAVARLKLAERRDEWTEISLADIHRLPGQAESRPGQFVRRILADFFSDTLGSFELAERSEAIDILEQLITGGRTRNIVDRSTLVNAPFRCASRRAAVLDRLVSGKVLRCEPKLGSYFVEITHEFLIPAILEKVRAHVVSHPAAVRLREAIRVLERTVGAHTSLGDGLLLRSEFNLIESCRHLIFWTAPAAERLLRCAIVLGAVREQLKTWIELFQTPERLLQLTAAGLLPSRDSWRGAHAQLEQDRELSLREVESMLRGALAWAKSEEGETIRIWTRRYSEHG